MLTRLKVSGFKNLVNVDVRFGAFTCIAGANGVGKSNLFDAIRFLSALSERGLNAAAQSIVNQDEYSGDIRELFHKVGDDFGTEMTFEVEMVIPRRGLHDLGHLIKTHITVLRYTLVLTYGKLSHELQIVKEELASLKKDEFVVDASSNWIASLRFNRQTKRFIWTDTDNNGENTINIDNSSNNTLSLPAKMLRGTFLSSPNLVFHPTVYLTKREMQSWRLLKLEPSALRKPDRFSDTGQLGTNGAHLPSTIERLIRSQTEIDDTEVARGKVLAGISNQLAQLIENVRQVYIDRDEGLQRLTVYLQHLDGTAHPAHALSDGTLRFLALAVLAMDDADEGLICLEEPENGLHPGNIRAMLQLLRDLVTDMNEPLDSENPLRQVIISTHSPMVIAQIPDDSLVFAKLVEVVKDGKRYKHPVFGYLADTWRANIGSETTSLANLHSYLNLPSNSQLDDESRLVIKRDDVQEMLSPTWERS
jgi:predicted ATPase